MKFKQSKLFVLGFILAVLYYHSQYLAFSGVEGKRIPVDGWLFMFHTILFDFVFLFIYSITEKKEHDKILYGVYFVGVNFIAFTSKTSEIPLKGIVWGCLGIVAIIVLFLLEKKKYLN